MGRRPRVEYPGGLYHVIQRGNNREYIFAQREDKEYWLKQIQELKDGMGYKVYGYVLMGNHYHLMLQTLDKQLQTIMHRLNTRYSKHFNFQYKRTGHVFEGRYKAIPVYDDRYLTSLLRYIHQNPVQAGICKSPADYVWSSDRAYRNNRPGFVEIDLILDLFSDNRRSALQLYRTFMEQEETVDYDRMVEVGDQFTLKGKIADLKELEKKDLDTLLGETGVTEEQFSLIKSGSRIRELTIYKLAYVQAALAQQYTKVEIGKNISMTAVAVHKLLSKNT